MIVKNVPAEFYRRDKAIHIVNKLCEIDPEWVYEIVDFYKYAAIKVFDEHGNFVGYWKEG